MGVKQLGKRYLTDLIFIGLSVILALLLAERPGAVKDNKPAGTKTEAPDNAKAVKAVSVKEPQAGVDAIKELKARNIFSADGSYAQQTAKIVIPDIPYTLLGVVYGKEKKAFFREFTGAIVSLREGDKMLDEAVVSHIEKRTVKVKKGKEEKEYKIFNIKK